MAKRLIRTMKYLSMYIASNNEQACKSQDSVIALAWDLKCFTEKYWKYFHIDLHSFNIIIRISDEEDYGSRKTYVCMKIIILIRLDISGKWYFFILFIFTYVLLLWKRVIIFFHYPVLSFSESVTHWSWIKQDSASTAPLRMKPHFKLVMTFLPTQNNMALYIPTRIIGLCSLKT